MNFLFVCNIAMAACLLFWPVWFSKVQLRLPLVNPFSILFALGFPVEIMKLFGGPLFLIDDGLFDVGYQYALVMNNILIFSQTAGLIFFFWLFRSLHIDRNVPFQNIILTSRDLRRAERLFLLIFFVSFYLLASAEFGVINWLLNPRQGYQLYRVGQGHWYALAASSLSVSYLMAFLAKPTAHRIIWKTFFYIGLGFFLGAKGTLLAFFGAMLVFLWLIRWEHLSKMLVLGGPMVFALMLANLYLAISSNFNFRAVFEYFNYYQNAAYFYRAYLNGEIKLFHGDMIVSTLWGYVPRVLWQEKPFVYGITMINEIFYPGQAELTNFPAFGGAVEQFADFGFIGVIVFGFFSMQSVLIALLSYLIFRKPGLNIGRSTIASAMLLLVQFAPVFGMFFPGALYLLLLATVLVLIWLMRFRRVSFGMGEKMSLSNQSNKTI